MDTGRFLEILGIDSTSSKERALAEYIAANFVTPFSKVGVTETGDGTLNVMLSWGKPDVVFCTHLDTVPPYIPPSVEECGCAAEGRGPVELPAGGGGCVCGAGRESGGSSRGSDVSASAMADGRQSGHKDLLIKGRGSCDAKGQIISMYEACLELERRGFDGFGLLLLAGEETGSIGAKRMSSEIGGEYLIVGEPTDNKMIKACKGTKSFEAGIYGTPSHSGYPEYGASAVERFVDFMQQLRGFDFPDDQVLGKTTWNIGKLSSDNPQNILSGFLSFRIYFRTTFSTDSMVTGFMRSYGGLPYAEIREFGGDTPSEFFTLPGFDYANAAFGSDAPHLKGFRHKILYGPGSILSAHTDNEHVRISDIEKAVSDYVRMFMALKGVA